jgi:hypothetical protein
MVGRPWMPMARCGVSNHARMIGKSGTSAAQHIIHLLELQVQILLMSSLALASLGLSARATMPSKASRTTHPPARWPSPSLSSCAVPQFALGCWCSRGSKVESLVDKAFCALVLLCSSWPYGWPSWPSLAWKLLWTSKAFSPFSRAEGTRATLFSCLADNNILPDVSSLSGSEFTVAAHINVLVIPVRISCSNICSSTSEASKDYTLRLFHGSVASGKTRYDNFASEELWNGRLLSRLYRSIPKGRPNEIFRASLEVN